MPDLKGNSIKIITWCARIIVGITFIFSGFVKAVDPWGTFYKFQEYSLAIGLAAPSALILTGVLLLCAFEFIVGVCMVLETYRRWAIIGAALLMTAMLPLTLWIAISNPVSDCGCFGDAWVISNWATFWKNVVLTALIIWLLIYNRRCDTLISVKYQWIVLLLSVCFIFSVALIGYSVQPLLDFRPYKVGAPLLSDSEDDGNEDYTFIFEKDGERKAFGVLDELPSEEDGWRFVERQESENAASPAEDDDKTFRIWDRDGAEDVTEDVITDNPEDYLILIPEIEPYSDAAISRLKALKEKSDRDFNELIVVVAATPGQIADLEVLLPVSLDIFTADDTAIKEVARGNPAIVSMSDGKIQWKSTLQSVSVNREGDKISVTPSKLATCPVVTLVILIGIYLLLMMLPIGFSIAEHKKSPLNQ